MPSRLRVIAFTLAVASLACRTLVPATPAGLISTATPVLRPTTRPTSVVPSPAAETTEPAETQAPQPVFTANGIRYCDYVPGVSVSATMPAELLNPPTPQPFPVPALPPAEQVGSSTTAQQLRIYRELWQIVNDNYVYLDFLGRDWESIGEKYEQAIRRGMTDETFYLAMDAMIAELGDEHSQFQSPEMVKEEEASLAGQNNFVGVGILVSAVPETEHAVIVFPFPDSPAAEAGLRAHDAILAVDGEPVVVDDVLQTEKIRGPEGTPVTLTIQRPGEEPHDVTMTRRRITSAVPLDYCLVRDAQGQDTRIAYIFLPSYDDETLVDQMREALRKLTEDEPLNGLVLDNRQNGGGSSSVVEPILGFFTEGTQGHFISRTERRAWQIFPEDIGGSQTVPLVVLIDQDTASFGEISSGVLGASGRATLVGQTTLGNVELLLAYDFEDGSRVWLASETFEPLDQKAGIWEEQGIVPTHKVPTRWDLFTEANDPSLAKAVEILQGK
jgi:C-terminal peptidase prc